MEPSPKIQLNIRVPQELVARIAARSQRTGADSASAQVREDMNAICDAEPHGPADLRETLNRLAEMHLRNQAALRERFSPADLAIIKSRLEGAALDAPSLAYLAARIFDSLRLQPPGKEFGIDPNELVGKLQGLSYSEAWTLIEMTQIMRERK